MPRRDVPPLLSPIGSRQFKTQTECESISYHTTLTVGLLVFSDSSSRKARSPKQAPMMSYLDSKADSKFQIQIYLSSVNPPFFKAMNWYNFKLCRRRNKSTHHFLCFHVKLSYDFLHLLHSFCPDHRNPHLIYLILVLSRSQPCILCLRPLR